MTRDELRAFVGATAARLRSRSPALITLGGGRVRFASEWDDPAYGLDFVQMHSYPDVRYQDRDVSLFGRTPPIAFRRRIGWRITSRSRATGGYLGAWPWSFKGVDAFGSTRSAINAANGAISRSMLARSKADK